MRCLPTLVWSTTVLVAAVLAGPAAAGPPAPAEGRIAFVSARDGSAEVYVMRADGQDQTRVTRTRAPESEPDWAPDGIHVAVEQRGALHVVRADGTDGTAQLTKSDYCPDGDPAWAPDGRRLAFTRVPGHLSVALATMTSDGRRQRFLADGRNGHPDWAPDGRRIAFTASYVEGLPGAPGSAGAGEIRVVRADGSGRAGPVLAAGVRPAWSPDGARIAFQAERGGNVDVYAMDADGGNVTRLTDDPAADTEPTWSPDATKIAFVSRRSGNADVYVMDANGDGETRLTDSSADDATPAWGPPPTLEPVALPAAPVPAPLFCQREQPRRVSFALRGHLRAVGTVGTRGAESCVAHVPVRVQRRTARRWRTVARATTGEAGRYSVRLRDRSGRYRAVAPRAAGREPLFARVCLRAVSTTTRHPH